MPKDGWAILISLFMLLTSLSLGSDILSVLGLRKRRGRLFLMVMSLRTSDSSAWTPRWHKSFRRQARQSCCHSLPSPPDRWSTPTKEKHIVIRQYDKPIISIQDFLTTCHENIKQVTQTTVLDEHLTPSANIFLFCFFSRVIRVGTYGVTWLKREII